MVIALDLKNVWEGNSIVGEVPHAAGRVILRSRIRIPNPPVVPGNPPKPRGKGDHRLLPPRGRGQVPMEEQDRLAVHRAREQNPGRQARGDHPPRLFPVQGRNQ